MDSISQFVLGAAVGEAVLGKKVGNKAAWWGALGGTIPDLDILANPFLDEVGRIAFHRGMTHSFFFIILLAPLLGWLIARLYRKKGIGSFRGWWKLMFWTMFTHPILDCFTTFGTQIWWPFSHQRVAWSSIFVADPIYTVPLLLSFLIILWLNRKSKLRRWINWSALGFSTAYLIFTLFNHAHVIQQFEKSADNLGLNYSRLYATPTPLNNVLWTGLVETEEGYHLGMYSNLDERPFIDLKYYEKNTKALEQVKDDRIKNTLIWFSDDYYIVREKEEATFLYDLRYGKTGEVNDDGDNFVFSFKMTEEVDGWHVKEILPANDFSQIGEMFEIIIKRAKGLPKN